MKKRIISAILLTLVAIFAFIPAISLTAEAAEESVTLSFADKANRISFSTTQQIWEENGIKLTNDKDSSTSDVADYAAPARFYKGSTITIEYPGMTKIVFACSGSNYAKAPTGLTGATASTSGTTLTITLNEPVDSFSFNCNGSQLRVTSMTVYYEAASETPECTHTNTTTETTKEATCTEAGSITVTCDDCEQVIGTEEIPALGHNYVDGVCSVCGDTNSSGDSSDGTSGYVLVTNASMLTVGDKIIIVAKDYAYALSTTQNGNNRGQESVNKNENSIDEISDSVQVLELQNGKTDGTFAFYTGSGYLYAASSSNNYLRTETTLSDNSSWGITISASGVATITAQGTNTRNLLKYNNTSSIFSCYSTGQKDICIYKLDTSVSTCSHTNTTKTTVDATCTTVGAIIVTCEDCGFTVSYEEIAALGHTYGEWVTEIEPGDTTAGKKTKTCSVCNETETEEIPATGFTVHFVIPDNMDKLDTKKGYPITLPSLANYESGGITYTFLGWSEEKITDTTDKPTVLSPKSKYYPEKETYLYAVFSWTIGGSVGGDYELTDLADISSNDKVVITVTTSGTVYALTSENGSSSAPTAVIITVSGTTISSEVTDDLIWNISNSSGNLTIYPDGTTSTWLYCTSANNGVRVGTNANNVFTLDSTTGYLKNTATSRYVGVYVDNPDWRCYTNTTGNIANQTLAFYVQKSGGTVYYKTIGCLHEDTTVEIIGNCGESGTKKITCNDCGYVTEESIAKIDHEYTVTEVIAPTCTSGGYTLNTCSRCGSTYRSDLTDASEHSFDANGSCTVCGALNAAVYDLSGKYYISTARADGNYWYMSSIINLASNGKTHRYSAVSSGLTTLPESITSPNLSRIFVLERINDGEDAGKYLIYAFGIVGEEKYVGYTVTDPENPENSATFVSRENALKLTIENVTAEKTFTFSFGEGDEKRSLALYSNPGSDFFAFYKNNSSQKKNLSLIPISFDGTGADEFTGASLNIGSDLSIRYHAVPNMESSLDSYSVRFTMNGKEVTVQGVAEDGKLVFSFKGISPQFMGSSIKAELLLDGEIIDTVESYSVKQYVIDAIALHSTDTYLCTLLSDVLYYGAAAQRYLNKNVAEEALVTYGVADLTPSEITTTDADKQRSIVTATGADTTLVKYTAAGVRFDYNNRIYVKFTTTDVANVTVTVSGSALEIIPLGNNTYVAYSEGISALEFDNTVSFKLYYGENLIQTLNYTVNTYAWDKSADSEIGDLALALYRYGKSTAAYEESKSINY